MRQFTLIFFLVIYHQLSASGELAQKGERVGGMIAQVPQKIGDMAVGFAQSFGICPSNYQHSICIWNDLLTPIQATIQSVTDVQGIKIPGKIAREITIPSQSFSAKGLVGMDGMCHGKLHFLLNSATFYSRSFDGSREKAPTYYYHAFSYHGQPRGELLGPGFMGGAFEQMTGFDAVFINNTQKSIPFSFTKDAATYTISLDPQSFALLTSTTTNPASIRPQQGEQRFFTFGAKNEVIIPIPAQGIGSVYEDEATKQKSVIPATYTYELYEKQGSLSLEIQGMTFGNFDQPGVIFDQAKSALLQGQTYSYPLIDRIRDINPITLNIWYQSPNQIKKEANAALIPINLDTTWACYISNDQEIIRHLEPGRAISFSVIRPGVDQKIARLIIIQSTSKNESRVLDFARRVAREEIGKGAFYASVSDATVLSPDILVNLKPNTYGIIDDTKGRDASGITGTILLVDAFSPLGMSDRPGYYVIPPATINSDSTFASPVISLLDQSLFGQNPAEKMLSDFQERVPAWLATFEKNKSKLLQAAITMQNLLEGNRAQLLESAVPDLTAYLKAMGQAGLFSNATAPKDQRLFNDTGKRALYAIFLGPISFTNLPIILQSGSNRGLSGGKPEGWPT